MPSFITFEGIDGSGKSTVLAHVAGVVRRETHRVWTTKEPTDGWLGRLVREAATRSAPAEVEALLFVADRLDHQRAIREHLASGEHVFSDRYFDSTRAYQGALLKDRFDRAGEWLEGLQPPSVLVPALTILLDVPPEVSLARTADRGKREVWERQELLVRVRAEYLDIAKRESNRFVVVNGERTLDTCVTECAGIIRKVLGPPFAAAGK